MFSLNYIRYPYNNLLVSVKKFIKPPCDPQFQGLHSSVLQHYADSHFLLNFFIVNVLL